MNKPRNENANLHEIKPGILAQCLMGGTFFDNHAQNELKGRWNGINLT